MASPRDVQQVTPRSARWWVTSRRGRLAVFQWPNPALVVWFVAFVLARIDVLADDRAETMRHVAQGALIVWAADELFRGSSPVRRVLGAVVLAAQLLWLFT